MSKSKKPAPPPAPAKRAASSAPPAPPPPPPPPEPEYPRTPVGVYLSFNRNTAIAVRVSKGHVWYLTMLTGRVTLESAPVEKFLREFRTFLDGYSVMRAVHKYKDSMLAIDEKAAEVIKVILRREVNTNAAQQ